MVFQSVQLSAQNRYLIVIAKEEFSISVHLEETHWLLLQLAQFWMWSSGKTYNKILELQETICMKDFNNYLSMILLAISGV